MQSKIESLQQTNAALKNELETIYAKPRKDKEELMKKVSELELEIANRKKSGMVDINERERAKIYAIKKLSEEMDYKVKETQANLMALNDEQLQTTTRLTILQNH